MSTELTAVPPEPLSEEAIKNLGIPAYPDSQPFTTKVINILAKIQQGSAYLFTGFVSLHLASVVITPALTDIDTAENVLTAAREVYQSPNTEWILVWDSMFAHVISGFVIRMIRNYNTRKNYGSKKSKKIARDTPTTTDEEKIEKDQNRGLGGLFSVLGFSSKKSYLAEKTGLSPLALSGYILFPMVLLHAFSIRILPLIVQGDSSNIDFGFISHLFTVKAYVPPVWTVLVGLATYHISSGTARYLRAFSIRARRICYGVIFTSVVLTIMSLYKIKKLGPLTGVSLDIYNKFDAGVENLFK
ncbi:hypothetical protein B5S31_g3948 [[Candida] boidinii]|nr:hypothetical protein B5S31_g3948 [[Candida] boidinii]